MGDRKYPRFLGAVYMKASYPAARVTRLAGLKIHSVYVKPSYPANMKHMFSNGQQQRAKLTKLSK